MFPSCDRQQVDDSSPFSLNHLHMVGSVIVNVVTFWDYADTCGQLEMVYLFRDKSNPYNRNAIKVLNRGSVTLGYLEGSVTLGYLEYSAADVLSPLIDANWITIQGFAKRSWESGFAQSNNEFQVPCKVHVFARLTEFEKVKSAIRRGGLLISECDEYSALSQPVMVKEKNHDIDEIFTILNLKVNKETVEALEPPRSMIKSELFPHQKEGLGWLVSRENSCALPPFWEEKKGVYVNKLTSSLTYLRPEPIKGGIFADDTESGKTLTLLSLIAYDKWTYSGHSSGNVDAEINEEQDEENNILFGEKSDRGQGSIWVLKTKQKAEDPNVIMMGDPTLAFDKPRPPLEPWTTLIVSPFVFSWVKQLEEHIIPGSFNVYIYDGEQTNVAEELKKYDIVLTTYGTLASDSMGSPILKIEWRRVILDEAHVIKNPKASHSGAVYNLKAKRRWAVTDRPVQNNIFDLFSLMVFLKLKPFSIQQVWESLIQYPLSQGDNKGTFHFQVLMESIFLRRTKAKCLVLPSNSVEIHHVILSKEEREEYDRMEVKAKKLVEWCISDDSRKRINYPTILSILMRLRQICTDLALCPADLSIVPPQCEIEDAKNTPRLLENLLMVLEDGEEFECPICLSPPTDTVITCCTHIFCRFCIMKTTKQGNNSCPMCCRPFLEPDILTAPSTSLTTSSNISSSKAAALLQLLSVSRDLNPSTKSVIFSEFLRLLFLLEEGLKEGGFKFLHLDGSKRSTDIVAEFRIPAPEGPTILLASLIALTSGVDLTTATTVYFMEPLLDPAIEEWAINTACRKGQREDVKVIRFIARDTIDERILIVQERKKQLPTKGSGNKCVEDRKEITTEDLRVLMNL
ncbi:Helicase-like transcription factor HLTF/DNA helicase RAD5, DEAD-box superfamily [Handroanthus impetiginosus]|uniref:Helicase-like transcription factor HLTF/DNA helicase RAD5, DEAD-box superfamily n=1 Tax=Handroanthus impetiginosus TaxID=429701 RepID=A0A2G9I5H9_9LAMI|nr:Helicase-like transcription factor HLTF/DNA helicase RAD5, DEAD-box superfamily [Handroanthus impetiginosus]